MGIAEILGISTEIFSFIKWVLLAFGTAIITAVAWWMNDVKEKFKELFNAWKAMDARIDVIDTEKITKTTLYREVDRK